MSDLILRSWQGKNIRHRADGFMSLTDMCQAGGKLFGNWYQLKATQDYLEALSAKHYWDSNSGPVQVNEGGNHASGLTGTWGDRRVAIRLAQWISPQFALQVDEWVEELMSTGSVSIKPQETYQEPLPALRPPIERVESLYKSLAFFGIDPENPRFKQGLQDLVGDTLGLSSPALPASTEKWYGVAERAQQLGIPVGLVTKYRSPLGTRIKSVMPESDRREEERLCNGTQRPIKIYRVSDQLDNAIQAYFAPMLAVAS